MGAKSKGGESPPPPPRLPSFRDLKPGPEGPSQLQASNSIRRLTVQSQSIKYDCFRRKARPTEYQHGHTTLFD